MEKAKEGVGAGDGVMAQTDRAGTAANRDQNEEYEKNLNSAGAE